MKKILLSLLTLLSATVVSYADGLVVNDVFVQQDGTATVTVELNNGSTAYRAALLTLTLPDGVEVVLDEFGDPVTNAGARLSETGYGVSASHLDNGTNRFAVMKTSGSEVIPGESGSLFSFSIHASSELVAGSKLTATVSDIKLTDATAVDHAQDDFTFSVNIEEKRIILDETSVTMPEAAANVDVRLNRSIKAGEWSTIVLPFATTGDQVKAAFGNDVELAEFTAWASEEDAEGAIVGIDVTFTSVPAANGIEANTPMLIRVSEAVETATFDGVTLEPEAEPMVQVGRRAAERGWFHGTFVKTTVPEENLFLNSSKFYYSTGKTAIKGYRGYFEFRDVLDAYYDVANVKFNFYVDGLETGIEGMGNGQWTMDNVYDLSGRSVKQPQQRGIYIVNGKKVVVK